MVFELYQVERFNVPEPHIAELGYYMVAADPLCFNCGSRAVVRDLVLFEVLDNEVFEDYAARFKGLVIQPFKVCVTFPVGLFRCLIPTVFFLSAAVDAVVIPAGPFYDTFVFRHLLLSFSSNIDFAPLNHGAILRVCY